MTISKVIADAPPDKVRAYLDARDRLAAASAKKLNLYLHDPVAFIHDCVEFPEGVSLTPYQEEVMSRLTTEKRVAQRGPHGLGKSASAALLVHWFSLTRDALGIEWKVITTAGSWHQLTAYLWPEIHKWSKAIRWDKIGREPYKREEFLRLSLQLNFGAARSGASSDPSLLEGAHADSILVIFDEAKAIVDGTFDALEGALSGGGSGQEAFALCSSTPGEPQGRFYDIHSGKEKFRDWWTKHVKLEEAIEAKRINPEWVDDRRRQWGERSALFQNRVMGEFYASDEEAVIPLSWVELAIDRWYENETEPRGILTKVGVDVARGGEDATSIARIYDKRVQDITYFRAGDGEMSKNEGKVVFSTVATERKVKAIIAASTHAVAVVDADGLGVGVYDHLREELGDDRVKPFHAKEATDWKDNSGELQFADTRSAAWYGMRQMLDPQNGSTLELPDDNQLLADLSAPHYAPGGVRGKVKVESKDEVKKRLSGRSTDAADSVIMGLWEKKKRRRRRMVWGGET